MSQEDNFFIGWKGDTTANHKKSIKRLLVPIFIVAPLVLLVIVYFTKPFTNSVFELGQIKEFTGVYHESPFPVLLLDKGQLEQGTSTSALLVGFGKNGAKTYMHKAEETNGKLSGKRIKIQGTLIYGDGRTLIELTKKENSLLEVMETEIKRSSDKRFSNVSLKGEIVDPKCWFGVMKPAEGKVHKSCAIRCISGGIPPVFKVEGGTSREYCILKGPNGEDINKDILEYVGEPVSITGKSYLENGWLVLRVDPESIYYLN